MRPTIPSVVLAVCAAACPHAAFGQLTFEHLAQTNRASRPARVAAAGGYVYVTDVSGILTYDISTPAAADKTTVVETPGMAGNVYVSSGHLYVLDGYAGLRVYSLADAGSPALTASLEGLGHCYDIRFVGDRAFVASYAHPCIILDVTNRSQPSVTSLGPSGKGYGIEVVGSYAYCVDASSLELNTYDVSGDTAVLVDTRPSQGGMYEMASGGGFLYVCGSDVEVFDLSVPASPSHVAVMSTSGDAKDVLVSGTTAWVASYMASLQVFDVTNPAAPSLLRTVAAPGESSAVDLARDGNVLAVADDWNALHLFDVSAAADPAHVASVVISEFLWAQFVDLDGDYAYLALTSDTFRILDVSAVSQPVEVASIPAWDNIMSGSVFDGVLYICALGGLKIVDVTDPTDPIVTMEDESLGTCYGACGGPGSGGNRYAYVAHGGSGFSVVDVTAGSVVRTVATGGDCRDIECVGSHLYVPALDLLVYDVSIPADPALLGTVAGITNSYRVCGGGPQRLFVISTGKVSLLDVSSPASPTILDQYEYQSTPPCTEGFRDIAYEDGVLYLAREFYGVRALAVSNDVMSPEALYDTPMRAYGLDVQNGIVAVADDWSGLHLLRARAGPNAPPTSAIDADQTEGYSPLVVDFASAGDDPDGWIVDWSWDFGDGETGAGATVSHAFVERGGATVTLTVTDDEGATASASVTVNVLNRDPIAAAAVTSATAEAGEDLGFDASGSTDGDGDTLSYEWDFGDAVTGAGVAPAHYYRVPGVYTVTLTVEDGMGGSDGDTVQVDVTAAVDSDTDGLPDVWELSYFTVLSACGPAGDADGDGLDDDDEFLWGTDPSDEDTDDDGYADGAEVVGGSDPLDTMSFPPPVPGQGRNGGCVAGVVGGGALWALLLAAALFGVRPGRSATAARVRGGE